MTSNINYTIIDESKKTKYNYKDILEEVEIILMIKKETQEDIYINLIVEYNNLFSFNELQKIAEYYGLNINKNKGDLINNIIEFEKNKINSNIVCKRKKLWAYITELKGDKYLKQFVKI
jgi:hypothetical protein